MRRAWRRFRTRRLALGSLAVVLVLLLAGALAPVLFPLDPNEIGNDVLQPPQPGHWMGTDELGRDVLAGIVHGIRISVSVGVLSATAALLLGGVIGALAGYAGGRLDLFVMRLSEIFQVVPAFILAAVLAALSGPGAWQIIGVIAALSWPQVARVMRGEVIRLGQLDWVAALRCLGIADRSILWREILPNTLSPVLAVATLVIGSAILLEASLSFLGLSNPDVVSWGRMLNSGQRFLFMAWWMSVFPGLAIVVTVLAFNLLGDQVAAALDPGPGR